MRAVLLGALLHGRVKPSCSTSPEEEKSRKEGSVGASAPNCGARGIQALVWCSEKPGSNLLLLKRSCSTDTSATLPWKQTLSNCPNLLAISISQCFSFIKLCEA